jgi:uncharacterized protein YsxB (DUF464 family)
MIEINVRYKRYRMDHEVNYLMLQELVIENHSRQTKVCNMVSAISLYGIKALKQKHHWNILTKFGLLYVRNIYPDGSSSTNDYEVMRTIVIQLNELAKQFPKEIKFRITIDPPQPRFDSVDDSHASMDDELSVKKSHTGKTGQGI